MILDTSVLIALERGGRSFDMMRYRDYGEAFVSAITVSELLVGVHYADTELRRVTRMAFVEAALARFEVLAFTRESARLHAQLYVSLRRKGQSIGAHDLIIAATALHHGFAVVTGNVGEFERVDGLQVLTIQEER